MFSYHIDLISKPNNQTSLNRSPAKGCKFSSAIKEKMPLSFLSILFFWFCSAISLPAYSNITFSQNQADIVVAPYCNHVPINIPYTQNQSSFDDTLITVSSDSNWAIPNVNSATNHIEITFATEELFSSYTATISVDDGATVTDLFISATVAPLDVYRLVDDPLRSRMYGIQRNGIYSGSVFAFDPIQETLVSCITVGESPTDFVINDSSSELLVINSVSRSIDVIDLETFSLKESITLPAYNAWGDTDDTTANIDLGSNDTIYYTDGSWGPALHVLKRNTGQVIQSIIFNGSTPTNNTGFMDFAVNNEKTGLIAMPQYGWSAGSHSPTIGQFSINANGTVNFVKSTSLSSFSREPFEAPVLISENGQVGVMKTISTSVSNVENLDRVFPSTVWSMNPNGTIVATGDALYDYESGNSLYSIPGGSTNGSGNLYTKAQAFSSDFTRFVYFDSANRALNVVNLIEAIGLEQMGLSLSPSDNAVVTAPNELVWAPLTGVDQYDLYLGTDYNDVATANSESSEYLGRVTGTSIELTQTLVNGEQYHWRADPVTLVGPETGPVYGFTVAAIGLDMNEIDVRTVTGHADYQVDIQLYTDLLPVSWTASAEDPWITFAENSGATPATLSVHLDATTLPEGIHQSTITLATDDGDLQIPVTLRAEPLNITHIKSDRNSEIIYAISEDTSNQTAKAYLLEIDSAEEKINRVRTVGSSVTDFDIHYPDNLIYITNWKNGILLAIDRDTFENTNSIAFRPAGATGYSDGDVYRIAAGASQRIVVEEEDQWIDISLFNTSTESTLARDFVREGGGEFGPGGRYYYHGENNSSGAAIIKYDTSGDIFTNLAEVRPPEISSYYGSRTVVVSEDGSRIFWAGVALDQNLATEWGIGRIIYSSSTDGRYAFSDTAIYDVNVKRQILEMPLSTTVSGYNSTSEKLLTQVNSELKFYGVSTPITIPAPELIAVDPDYNTVTLEWTDDSLEMAFVVQQRELNTLIWTDIHTTAANVTSVIAAGLKDGTNYEFRVRASSPDYSSPWSNVATITTLEQPNQAPVARGDFVTLPDLANYRFSIIGNDFDYDGEVDPDSIRITTSAQFGSLSILSTGEVSYLPNDNFDNSDSFSYTIDDDDGATSSPATVSLIYIPPNQAPVAEDDVIRLTNTSGARFSVLANDTDDGQIDPYSIEVVTQPQFGTLTAHFDGDLTYIPGSNFIANDSFSYTIRDNEGEISNVASVQLAYVPAPLLIISNVSHHSINLSWIVAAPGMDVSIQQKTLGSANWIDIPSPLPYLTTWTAGNLEASTIYEFRMRATSSGFSSSWSNIAIATTNATPESNSSGENDANGDDPDNLPPTSQAVSNPTAESNSNGGGGGGSSGLFVIFSMLVVLCRTLTART